MSTESGVASVYLRNGSYYAKIVNEHGKRSGRNTGFTRLLAKAGVERDVIMPGGIKGRRSFHSLRHSFTNWLAEADVHSDIRRKLTGHRSYTCRPGTLNVHS